MKKLMVDLFRPCRNLMRKKTSRFPTKPTAQTTEYTTEMSILRMGVPSSPTSMSSKRNFSSPGELRFTAPLWLNVSSIFKVRNYASYRLDENTTQTPHATASQLFIPIQWTIMNVRLHRTPVNDSWPRFWFYTGVSLRCWATIGRMRRDRQTDWPSHIQKHKSVCWIQQQTHEVWFIVGASKKCICIFPNQSTHSACDGMHAPSVQRA